MLLLFIVCIVLFSCKKSSNSDLNAYNNITTIGLRFEKPYLVCNSIYGYDSIFSKNESPHDTIIFHSNETITENNFRGSLTCKVHYVAINGYSTSVLQNGQQLQFYADTTNISTEINGFDFIQMICLLPIEYGDTCTIGTYLSGNYLYLNRPTIEVIAPSFSRINYGQNLALIPFN